MTADNSSEARRCALSYGAIDFVTQPFDRSELELRVRNHLHTRRLALELEAVAGDSEERARRAEHQLDSARMEVLERLAHAAEFRDDEGTLHTWRVGRLSGMIAAERLVRAGASVSSWRLRPACTTSGRSRCRTS